MGTVPRTEALSRFGYALSDATRTRILLSVREGPGYPFELAESIGVSRQILSNHLACLRGSQPYPWLHTRNHVAMFALALRQHDRREALGQVVRIVVAAPGSALGRYPEGNTGRVAAGLMTPMPIPADLAHTTMQYGHSAPRT